MHRRDFIKDVAIAGSLLSMSPTISAQAGVEAETSLIKKAASAPAKNMKVTIAQTLVEDNVAANFQRMKKAFDQAIADGAGWIVFPEGALSGYTNHFKQSDVEPAYEALAELCKKNGIIGLISTCWYEPGDTAKPHNEIRIIDQTGKTASRYAKTILTYSDATAFVAGGYPMVHDVGGIRIGTLICNDMWVTPGYCDGPNTSLSLQIARQGAQVLFHAVNSGSAAAEGWHRNYHQSNVALRSAEAKIPFVEANAAHVSEQINCTSGVMHKLAYQASLPLIGEAAVTVDLSPWVQVPQ
jgi:predicted amidohydrolase